MITKDQFDKHRHHKKHKHENLQVVGRGGYVVPGMPWWSGMYCATGMCGGVGPGQQDDHDNDEKSEQEESNEQSESQESNDTATPGGEAGEAGSVTTGSGASAGSGGM